MELVYDAFVSASRQDYGWVDTFLVPSLENAGLRVCLPKRDFDLGLPEIVNTERAVSRSRKVLLVLTPEWIKGEFSSFEALLSQTEDPAGLRRKTLPLLLADCSLPPRIRTLTAADFRDSDLWLRQTKRVIKAIGESEYSGTLPENLEEILRLFLATNFDRDQYARLDQAGESDDRTTLLRKVFVDLHVKLRSGPQPEDFRWGAGPELGFDIIRSQQTDKPLSAMRWLLSERKFRAVVVGGPGQGKSTLGQYLAQAHRASLLGRQQEMEWNTPGLASARKQEYLPTFPRVPFRIILKYLAQWMVGRDSMATVEMYIIDQIKADTSRIVGIEEINLVLRTRAVLVIFDGLDEVIDSDLRTRLLAQIQEFLQRAEELRCNFQVIATSRPTGYTDQFSPEYFGHLDLQPMTVEKVRDYAVRWSLAKVPFEEERRRILDTLRECQAEEHTRLLLTTPLQVSIVLVIIKDGGRPPSQREALFQEYWSTIFRRERAKGKGIIRSEETLLFNLHAFLGYLLHQKALRENVRSLLTKEEFERYVTSFIRADDRLARATVIRQRATDIVREATRRLVLLVEPEPGLFGFELRSIQEFFAGVYLSQSARDTTIRFRRLRGIALSEHWRNVALFFAGRIVRNFSGEAANILELVRRPIDREMSDHFLRRGAWLALDMAVDGVFSNRDLQYGAIEHALSVIDGALPDARKHRLQIALSRLSSEDRRYIVKPILMRRIGECDGPCRLLADLLEILGGLSVTRKTLVEGLNILLKGDERQRADAFRMAVGFRVDPEWLGHAMLAHWEAFLGSGAVVWASDINLLKYMYEVLRNAALTREQAIQLSNVIVRGQGWWGRVPDALRVEKIGQSIADQLFTFAICLGIAFPGDVRLPSSGSTLRGLALRDLSSHNNAFGSRAVPYSKAELLLLLKNQHLIPSLRVALWSLYWLHERPRGADLDRFFSDIETALNSGVDRELLRILRFDYRWPLVAAAIRAWSEPEGVQRQRLITALRHDHDLTISRKVQEQLAELADRLKPDD